MLWLPIPLGLYRRSITSGGHCSTRAFPCATPLYYETSVNSKSADNGSAPARVAVNRKAGLITRRRIVVVSTGPHGGAFVRRRYCLMRGLWEHLNAFVVGLHRMGVKCSSLLRDLKVIV